MGRRTNLRRLKRLALVALLVAGVIAGVSFALWGFDTIRRPY